MQVNQTCANGHDLTLPNAFVFSASGLRSCRLCSDLKRERPGRRRDDVQTIGRCFG